MKKVVITGAAGFIGSSLANRLKDECKVVAIDNLSYGCKDNLDPSIKLYEFDVALDSLEDMTALFFEADVVFHMAAISSLPECQRDPGIAYLHNVVGTANVLEASRRAGVRRVVFSSTGAVYENMPIEEQSEHIVIKPTSLIYPSTKLASEQLCSSFVKAYGMNIITLRYFNVYGPGQNIKRKSPPFTAYVVRELLAGRRPVLHSDGEQRRDYVYINDVVEANLRAWDTNAHGMTFNICSGDLVSVRELYNVIHAQLRITNLFDRDIEPIYNASDQFWSGYKELYECAFPLKNSLVNREVNKITRGSTLRSEHVLQWTAKTSIGPGLLTVIQEMKDKK